MTLDLHVRQRLACPKHTRYNPEREGEAGIKGGCAICTDLLKLYVMQAAFLGDIDDVSERIIAARNART